MSESLKFKRGSTITELMIASALLSGGVLIAVSSFKFITSGIHLSRQKTISNNLAQEKMEVLKNLSYYQLLVTTDAATNTDYSPPLTYDMDNYPPELISLWGMPPFTRAVHVAYADISGNAISTVAATSSDPGLKQITVYVFWEERGVRKKIEIKNLLANPSAAALDSGFLGNVTIAGTGANLAGAEIKVIGSPYWQAHSDSSGYYQFAVAKGSYSLSCSSAGFYSATIGTLSAGRGAYTDQDFVLTRIATGTVEGLAWISTGLVISQVVASTGTYDGVEVEYVELYNPTTFQITIGGASPPIRLFKEIGNEPDPADPGQEIDLTFNNTSVASQHYFLIASTTHVTVNGVMKNADAVYNTGVYDELEDARSGGVGIKWAATGEWIDRVAWAKSGGENAPVNMTEGSHLVDVGGVTGLGDGEQFARISSSSFDNTTLGRAFDNDNNIFNFVAVPPYTFFTPHNSLDYQPAIAGRPAYGAFVSVNDGLSLSTVAYNRSGGNPAIAVFSITGVATGTWSVTLATTGYTITISSVIVTQGQTTYVPNAISSPAWNAVGCADIHLSSMTEGGFVQGYVYGSGTSYNQPLSGILVEAAGSTVRTTHSGFYMLPVSTGSVAVHANFNLDNDDYFTEEAFGTVSSPGDIVFVPPSPYFHLIQGGYIQGYVTAGTGALPNITVRAYQGSTEYEGVSDQTGYFYINASTKSTAYTLAAVLDPLQTYATTPTSPLTATLTAPGSVVFAGTITVTGALGTITGSVQDTGSPITTGVLIVASTATINDPPMTIYASSAPAMSAPIYSASSQADGTYELEVRAWSNYNVRAFYPIVNAYTGSISYSSKLLTGVSVTAGAATTGKDFSWP